MRSWTTVWLQKRHIGSAQIARCAVAHNHSRQRDVFRGGKLQSVRKSAIQCSGVIGRREHLLKRRVEIANGLSAFVEVADSIIEFDSAIEPCKISPC